MENKIIKPLKKINQRAWQRMLSGRKLDILSPSPFDIEIEDIALGLSRVTRWNGQTTGNSVKNKVTNEEMVKSKNLPNYIYNW